jgi:hypothetical protein
MRQLHLPLVKIIFAFAIASPTNAASVRIFFWCSSGGKGLPFSIPKDRSMAIMMRSRSCTGSSLIQRESCSQ